MPSIFPIVFGLVALIMFGVAIYLANRNARYDKGIRTAGVVVDHVRHSNSDGADTFALVIDWQSKDGNIHQFTTDYSTSHPDPIGTTIPVEFLPDDPSTARAGTWASKWLGPAITGLIGVVFGFLAVVFFVAGI